MTYGNLWGTADDGIYLPFGEAGHASSHQLEFWQCKSL